jgi:hypothetical protein
VHTPRTAPISAIPARSSRPARKGCDWPGGLAVAGWVSRRFSDPSNILPGLRICGLLVNFVKHSPDDRALTDTRQVSGAHHEHHVVCHRRHIGVGEFPCSTARTTARRHAIPPGQPRAEPAPLRTEPSRISMLASRGRKRWKPCTREGVRVQAPHGRGSVMDWAVCTCGGCGLAGWSGCPRSWRKACPWASLARRPSQGNSSLSCSTNRAAWRTAVASRRSYSPRRCCPEERRSPMSPSPSRRLS